MEGTCCIWQSGLWQWRSGFLKTITELCSDPHKTYYLGGYSLAGLFSLWAAYQTNLFAGIAAASPSVWFPGFLDYAKLTSSNLPVSI